MNPLQKHFEQNSGRQIHKWMHFYDGIVVFEKDKVVEPHHEMRGSADWDGTGAARFDYSCASRARSLARRARRRVGPAARAVRGRLSRG